MAELLRVEALRAGYGEAVVHRGARPRARRRAVRSPLLGRNGVGKTTLLNRSWARSTCDAAASRSRGADMSRLPLAPPRPGRARLGAAGAQHLPLADGRTKTSPRWRGPGAWTLARVYAMFPRLGERRANLGNQLSGGEQQMLAIGRALMLNPSCCCWTSRPRAWRRSIVEELLAALKSLAAEGLSMIVVEQKTAKILRFADEAIILNRGAIVHRAAAAALIADEAALHAHLTAAG